MTPREAAHIVLRVPNWLGDAVMCEPAIRAVHRVYPRARLTMLGRSAVVDLLNGHPHVADTMVYDYRGRHQGLMGKWSLAQELRARRFDLAVLFQHRSQVPIQIGVERARTPHPRFIEGAVISQEACRRRA